MSSAAHGDEAAGSDESAADGPVEVTVRYWAAARAAAGIDSERLTGTTIGDVLDLAVEEHPGLAPISRVATFLLDGRAASRDSVLTADATLEVLPPFAGG